MYLAIPVTRMKSQFFDVSIEDRMHLGKAWGWLFTTGLILFILGAFALTMPFATTLGVTFAFAGLLVVGGVIHLINAIKFRFRRGSVLRFLQSIISIVTGALIFRYPDGGMLGIAFALSYYFFIQAAFQWIFYYSFKPESGWGWGMTGSILSFFCGVFIILTFPFSAMWVPGLILGVDFMFAGSMLVGLAFSSRKISKEFRAA